MSSVRRKFSVLVNDLDERARRRWAAVGRKALGRGGISVVSRAHGGCREAPFERACGNLSIPSALAFELPTPLRWWTQAGSSNSTQFA